MDIDLIYESIYSGLALMDSQVQIWTTFTFALLVAVHVGENRITPSIFKLAIVLYGLYASVLVLRNVSATYQILHYQRLLVERDWNPGLFLKPSAPQLESVHCSFWSEGPLQHCGSLVPGIVRPSHLHDN